MSGPEQQKPMPKPGVRRAPEKSFVYDRVIPAALIGMAVLMGLILLLAAAILLGILRL